MSTRDLGLDIPPEAPETKSESVFFVMPERVAKLSFLTPLTPVKLFGCNDKCLANETYRVAVCVLFCFVFVFKHSTVV